ncbi:MAG TPA: hypothetical protein VIN07_15220 [Flavipsychrobacter sp.]
MKNMKIFKELMNYRSIIIILISSACTLASCETMKQNMHYRKHITPHDAARAETPHSKQEKLSLDIQDRILLRIIEESCNTCIPQLCATNACEEEICQQTIRNCHSNTMFQMQSKIQQFTGGLIPEPKVVPAFVIDSLLKIANCTSNDLIQLCANHDIVESNSDIVIGIYPILESPLCDEEAKSINESIEYFVNKLISDDKQLNKAVLKPLVTKGFVKYSYAMLSGVTQLEPTAYHFYKAKSLQHEPGNCGNLVLKNDIVFAAVDAQGQVLFYGDVSDLFP